MIKLIKFLFILFLGVMCSACVNKFAVHELNQLAIEHLENGDVDGAIARLESSVDLDPEQYESRYNLANVYIGQKKCLKALEHMDVAINLIKDEPVANYTLAVACDCAAQGLNEIIDKDGKTKKITHDDPVQARLSGVKEIGLLQRANENYEIYLKLVPNVEGASDIYKRIEQNKARLISLTEKYGHDLNANNHKSTK